MNHQTPPSPGTRGPGYLFCISFVALFLELALIRWVGSEIRIFAYFRNLTLISCFLGLGIGFGLKRFRLDLLFSLGLIAALTLIVHPRAEIAGVSFRKISSLMYFSEYNVWQTATEPVTIARLGLGYAMISVIVIILALIFIPFGQVLAGLFAAAPSRVRAYSINLAGSLAGTWGFAALCWFDTPPWMWFLSAAGGTVALLGERGRRTVIGLALAVPILLATSERDPDNSRTFWSPYQKLTLTRLVDDAGGERVPFYNLEINSANYMMILDLSPAQFQRYPRTFRREDAPYYPYDLPYRFIDPPADVLVVGAGGGNDVAAALRNGAKHVDAVEIDPVIARLGSTYNDEKPYQDPRVTLHVDDARSFFKKTRKRYDLIVFALLDSHTLTSNFTNINLDSYVYTRESITEARSLLSERGAISLSFFVAKNREWIGRKLFRLMEEVFGSPPVIVDNFSARPVRGTGSVIFLGGLSARSLERARRDPRLSRLISPPRLEAAYGHRDKSFTASVPTDDWPYLYLKGRRIPALYIILTAVLIALMAAALRFFFPEHRVGPGHFFFLGAGFMLVEVHSISKAALLFGSTWIVNAVIISAILAMVLAANQLVLRLRFERMRWWYVGLVASLALSFILPVDRLMVGSWAVRGVIAGTFYSLPLFFAGVIFACSLERTRAVEDAFAANMLGSTVGGMLESASFVFGLRAVILIAIGLYLLSARGLKTMPLREE